MGDNEEEPEYAEGEHEVEVVEVKLFEEGDEADDVDE